MSQCSTSEAGILHCLALCTAAVAKRRPTAEQKTGGCSNVLFFVAADLVRVKVKFTLELATKVHKGSRGIVLLFP